MSKDFINIKNRKASHEYEFIDKYVAGIALKGTDIKSIRDYKSNWTFINIDTKALADQAKGTYYGSPKINDYIVGETSGAIAKISNKDMVTDKKGNLRG